VIRSLGLIDVTTLPITVNYSGAATGTLNFTYTDTLGFNEYDTVNVGIINTYLGGTYNFNGFVTLSGDQDITNDSFPPYSATFVPFVPQGINGVGCGVDSAYIYGASYPGTGYFWYATPTDTTPLANADSFLIPSITAQNTYYLEYASNSDSLESTFAGGNSCGGGTMIDVTATSTVNINGLTLNSTTGANLTFQLTVHWIPNGTYVGNETNAAAWPNSIGPFTVTSAGNGNETYVDLQGGSITIPSGATYAMYFEYTSSYTNGAFTYTNADMTIQTGVGLCSAFSGVNNPRSFNGRLLYGTTACSNIRVPVSAVTSPGVSVALGNDTTFCGSSYVLDAGTNATNYDWSTSATTQTITATTSGNYSVVVSDTFGCNALDSINLTLSIPPAVALGPDILLCDGASQTLNAGSPGSTYNWSTGGTNQMETVSAAGTVSVMVTDSNGCIGMDTVVVTTGATPAANFSSTVGGQGLTYAFSDLSTGVPTTWSWNFGDSNTDNTQNPTHTYAAAGSYTVTLTVTNACGSNVFTQSLTVVSVEQALAGGVVSLYPNPNNGRFNLEFRGLLADDVEMRIMNVKGQVVMETSIKEQGSFVKEVNMTNFSKGMYLMQISAQGEQIMQRFVVE
jgi:PKD repeat protein